LCLAKASCDDLAVEATETVMAELDERISRLQHLLQVPPDDCDTAVLRHNLLQLRQLRAELTADASA
jgi:hypothetical protein